jgi:hypothetical protein
MSGFIVEIGVYIASLLGTIYYALGDSRQRTKVLVIGYYALSLILVLPQIMGNPPVTAGNMIGIGMEIVLLIFFAFKYQYLDNM